MAGEYLKVIVGTYVAGIAASILLGINLIGISALVGLGTFFVGIPVMLYLHHHERVDADRVFRAGVTFGIGGYLFAVAVLFLFNAIGLEEFILPVRVATIPIGLYLAISWTRES